MMHRREFAGTLAGAIAGSMIGSLRPGDLGARTAPAINAARLNGHITELARFGANPQGGVSRVAYSDFDRQGRAYVTQLMRDAGLDVRVDAAGNMWGRRAGTVAGAKPIVFGSHIDSVPEGGNYDGTVGSLSAIEVAQALAEAGTRTRHPLEVVVWQNEEGGLYGSRAVSGQLTPAEMSNRAWSGKTISDGVAFIGGDPSRLDQARRQHGDIATYLELHIEQGGTLERDKLDIGVVEGIVGIKQWEVTVAGFQNHAGTTPMDQRHDALLSAARFVDMVNRIVRGEPGRQVGTVGRIQAFPGAPNVIPGRVVCTLELRDLDAAKVDRLYAAIEAESRGIGEQNQTTFSYHMLHENVPAPSDPAVRAIIEESARALGLTAKHLPSGAGHDAQSMATLGPMGMIFIPSVGGISHSPKEYSTPEDVARGASVLLGAVLRADAR